MSAFTLYGSHGSSNTDRVRLTLAECGLTNYKLELLDLAKGEQKSKQNMDRNPWGKVPIVVFPDGFTLYESRVICKYLAREHSSTLIPSASDHKAIALFDQAESEETLYFAEPAGKISFEKFVKKFLGLPTNEAIVSEAERSLEDFFDVADRLLGGREYMAGNQFTLVDISYIPLIQRLFACGYSDLVLGRVAVKAWWERCINRPAIRDLLAADKEAAAAGRR